ncbi:Aconitate/2-methylaconitate hydratase [subsurface metagenome]
MADKKDPFGVREILRTEEGQFSFFSLKKLEDHGLASISRMPFSIRILLESVLRHLDGSTVREKDVENLIRWKEPGSAGFPFKPARVLMQDFTGVPALVDLTAMRDALADLKGDPDRINPLIPVDLIIDHSVQVDQYGSVRAPQVNADKEFRRNRERYEYLRWGARAFDNFRVIPPAAGICHQVNLEYLARVVQTKKTDRDFLAFPDTLMGTDSHTTMIDGIGVLGWGVGGIEAEAVILGRPLYMLIPEVIGFRLTGRLKEGSTTTDLVLTITQILRQYGAVGKVVEFF